MIVSTLNECDSRHLMMKSHPWIFLTILRTWSLSMLYVLETCTTVFIFLFLFLFYIVLCLYRPSFNFPMHPNLLPPPFFSLFFFLFFFVVFLLLVLMGLHERIPMYRKDLILLLFNLVKVVVDICSFSSYRSHRIYIFHTTL